MRTLVVVASKHGSTRGIAEEIAIELRLAGLDVDVHDVADAPDVVGYDAVVLGSAVYMGSWMREAREWADRRKPHLRGLPVWLFSSGPLGDTTLGQGDPKGVSDLALTVGVVDHRVFPGRLECDQISRTERLIAGVVRAPYGDFRDWPAIQTWAQEIAATLKARVPA